MAPYAGKLCFTSGYLQLPYAGKQHKPLYGMLQRSQKVSCSLQIQLTCGENPLSCQEFKQPNPNHEAQCPKYGGDKDKGAQRLFIERESPLYEAPHFWKSASGAY